MRTVNVEWHLIGTVDFWGDASERLSSACRSPPDFCSATVTVIDTAKSTDQFMTPLGRSRDKCDLGAFDVPTLGAPAREGQVLLEKGLKT